MDTRDKPRRALTCGDVAPGAGVGSFAPGDEDERMRSRPQPARRRDQIVTKNFDLPYSCSSFVAANWSGAPLGLLRTSGGTP